MDPYTCVKCNTEIPDVDPREIQDSGFLYCDSCMNTKESPPKDVVVHAIQSAQEFKEEVVVIKGNLGWHIILSQELERARDLINGEQVYVAYPEETS